MWNVLKNNIVNVYLLNGLSRKKLIYKSYYEIYFLITKI